MNVHFLGALFHFMPQMCGPLSILTLSNALLYITLIIHISLLVQLQRWVESYPFILIVLCCTVRANH